MLRKILILWVLITGSLVLSAQVESGNKNKAFKSLFKNAIFDFNKRDYKNALVKFERANVLKPGNANVCYYIGLSHLYLATDFEKAVSFLEMAELKTLPKSKSQSPREKSAPLEAIYYLAKAYHGIFRFNDALTHFDEYKKKMVRFNKKSDQLFNLEKEILLSKNAIEICKYPLNVTIQNLGSPVNSTYADYSPILLKNGNAVLFTSRRAPLVNANLAYDGQYFEDIYYSEKINDKWTNPAGIGETVNSKFHEASNGLFMDSTRLMVRKQEMGEGDFYISPCVNGKWSDLEKLEGYINTVFDENFACSTPDGKIIIFSSNRPGGNGGYDLYMTKKLPNEKWSEPFNLGPNVNSEFDEITPYIHPVNHTLIFSSNGIKTIGGFDLMYSDINLEEGTVGAPENIGFPINSTADDFFFTLSTDAQNGFIASDRDGGLGYSDIYVVKFTEPIERKLAVLSGNIQKNTNDKYSGIQVTVTDVTDKTPILIGRYTPNTSNGKYIFMLAANRKYKAVYESKFFKTRELDLFVSKDSVYSKTGGTVTVQPIVLENLFNKINLSFYNGSSQIDSLLAVDLQKIKSMMAENKQAKLIIPIFETDSINSLYLERANAVIDFLTRAGISSSRVWMMDKIQDDYGIEIIQLDITNKELPAGMVLKKQDTGKGKEKKKGKKKDNKKK